MKTLKSLAQLFGGLPIAGTVATQAATVFPRAAKLAATAAKPVARFGFLAVGVAIDVVVIIKNTVDIHKGSPCDAANKIEREVLCPLKESEAEITELLQKLED